MSFATFPLETLNLPASILQACTRAGLATAGDVLLAAPGELSKKLRGGTQVSDVVGAVARAVAPASHTVEEILGASGDAPAYVSTGDAALDNMLGGGMRVGAITEVTGESAAGKSHLTLALAVAAQFGATPGGTIVLTSERVLAASRLVELATALRDTVPSPPPLSEILDNVHTSRVADIDALEHALAFVVPPMLAARRRSTHSGLRGDLPSTSVDVGAPPQARGSKPIRLIVLDSVTALLRGETERSSTGLAQRSRYLCALADRLKALAVEYELAVVVVNQVKDVFAPGFGVGVPVPSALPGVPTPNVTLPDEASATQHSLSQASSDAHDAPPMLYATQARHFSGQTPGFAKEAALGIVWANAVNARLMLARTGRRRVIDHDDLQAVGEDKMLVRRFHLVFSPFAPPATLDYIITERGIATLPSSLRYVDLGPAIRRRDLRLRAALPATDPASSPPLPPGVVDLDGAVHLGSDAYDDMDIPPELWDGLDADVPEPGSPVAVGVVD